MLLKKEIIALFSILLFLVCLIELFPTFYISWKENKAYKLSNKSEKDYHLKLDSITKNPLNLVIKEYNYNKLKDKQLKLGLDLQGGISLILEISQKDLLKNLSNYANNKDFNQILLEADKKQKSSSSDYINDFFNIYYNKKQQNLNLKLADKNWFGTKNLRKVINYTSSDKEVEKVIRDHIENSLKIAFQVIRKRIDRFGVVQPNVRRIPGSGRIQVELPGVVKTDRIKKILQTSARLEFWEVYYAYEFSNYLEKITPYDSKIQKNISPGILSVKLEDTAQVTSIIRSEKFINSLPLNLRKAKLLWAAKPIDNTNELILYALRGARNGKAHIEGSIRDASVTLDQMNRIAVNMQMDIDGTEKWANLTQKNKNYAIAIVLDDLVYTAPRVNEPINTGSSQISGSFSKDEAQDLVDILKSGKLPAKAKIIQAEIIGATLGKEAINNGLKSFFFAFILVLIYMMFYYGKAGFYANIALIANLFFIMGIMASMGFTLTLPGIAGIVLTLGMAVDANIIAFERIKEEIHKITTIKKALHKGQKYALSAIIDGNITTLITALILFSFGTGPIKGFAITLIIGIFCTLFTGVLLTHFFIEIRLNKNKEVSFWTLVSKNCFSNVNCDWIEKRKITYITSTIIILISVISLYTQGLNLGIDYKGGRIYVVKFPNAVNANELSNKLSLMLSDGVNTRIDVKIFGTPNQVKITTKYKIDDDSTTVDEEINSILYKVLKKYLSNSCGYEDFVNGSLKNEGIMSMMQAGATFTDDVQKKGYYAVGLSLFGIFLYILFRFYHWEFSIGAVVALFHDVLIVLGLFSLLYKILPFSLEIDQAFIAAILTVVGYSINDTVIVFDRIRENLSLHSIDSLKKVFNHSINQVLGRTFNTSFTTLLVTLIIFLFGGEGIRSFIFALLIGVVSGTFSSIFVASAITFDLLKHKFSNKDSNRK